MTRSNEILKRIIMALILAPLGFLSVWIGSWLLVMAASACGALMVWEWLRMMRPPNANHLTIIGGILAFGFCVLALIGPSLFGIAVIVTLVVVLGLRVSDRNFPAQLYALGLLYTAVAPACLVFVRSQVADGFLFAASVLFIVWVSDIAAYFAGRGFGGPLLSPKDSPNKTWSGSAGAFICAALVGSIFASIKASDIVSWVVFALFISLAAQLGDLLESHVKRRHNVKDTSGLIPGHGGVLDRLDSLCLAIIVAALLFSGFPASLNML